MLVIINTVLCWIVIGILIYVLIFKDKDNDEYYKKIDKDTAKIYEKELEKMIQYETIYEVSSAMGETYSSSMGTNIIENDQLEEIREIICRKIITNMSTNMRNFLVETYGEGWYIDYIRIYTLSMLINYTELNISKIISMNK